MAACGVAIDGSATAANQAEAAPAVPTTPSVDTNSILSLELASQAAIADAARRSGLAVASLKLLSAERVTWSDGSLGCPQPGMLYTQALVPGYRIRIQAGAATLDYHAGLRGSPRLCPPGQAQEPLAGDTRI